MITLIGSLDLVGGDPMGLVSPSHLSFFLSPSMSRNP